VQTVSASLGDTIRGVMRRATLAAAAALLVLPACGGSPSEPSSGVATVRFVYAASTTTNPNIPATLLACVRFSEPTHAHVGWRRFELVNMTAVGADRWELTQTDVPVGPLNLLLISDPNACFTQENGFATSNLTANGVTLTSRNVPDGGGPGFGFRVAANGTVTP
jgi:hypothetical protein